MTDTATIRAIKGRALTAERLREVLSYDEKTGAFTWRSYGRGAGSKHNQGYLAIRVDGRSHLCHRLAWLYSNGRWPAAQIDHINGDRSDNRLANLRECTNAQNAQNMGAHADGNCHHVGVCRISRRTSKPWLAQICVNGKQRRIGQFATELEAVLARAEAKAQFHPFGNGARQ